MGKQKKSRKGLRIALGILCVLLAIVLGVMVAGTVLADTILGNMNYVQKGQDATLSLQEAEALKAQWASEDAQQGESEDTTAESTEADTTETQEEEDDFNLDDFITEPIGEQKHITNILLVGQDSLKGIRERSDTMMLVTINTEKNSIIITSFMRDMYVKIPGYYKTKINEAYALGGMDLLNETLYENFGVVVDHNVEVSFGQFMDIIDYLGGIDLELDAKEAAFVNKATGLKNVAKEGMNHFDGYCALVYARYRDKTSGDFARTERQRKTLNALIEEYKNAELTTMIGMANELMGMITTNMTKAEVLNYAVRFFPMLSSAEIVSQRVPYDGKHSNGTDFYYMTMKDGLSVVVPRLPENVERLTESLS